MTHDSQLSPTRLATRRTDDILGELEQASHMQLDLTTLSGVERAAGSVLACALLGSLGDKPLQVSASKDAHLDWLTASGLAFAVANRSGHTGVEGADPGALAQWRQDWTPGIGVPYSNTDGMLFAPEMIGETAIQPDIAGDGFAAFINPHLERRRRGPHPVATVLWPWLNRLVPQPRLRAADTSPRNRLIADIGHVVDELVTNVGDHASAGRPIHSLVQLSVTRGGGQRSTNRLHVTVSDTGVGIPATARTRLDAAQCSMLTDDQLLFKLLAGSLGPWGRGRGQGLPSVTSVTRRHRGRLQVATKHARATLSESRGNSDLGTQKSEFRLDGTVVTVTLPLAC